MDFLLSSELREFSQVLRKLFAAPGENAWQQLADVGAFSAPLSEECGGLGMGTIAAAVVLEEAGRSLSPLPLLETLALSAALMNDGERTEMGAKILGEVAEGKARLTAAIVGRSDVKATKSNDVVTLAGACSRVGALSQSHSFLVPARVDAKTLSLFAIEPNAVTGSGVVTPVETFDLKRGYADITLKNTPGAAVVEKFTEHSFQLRTSVLAAAEMCGIASRVVEMTVEYSKTRKQFDRPIGSFQAIQHKLADMHLRAEQAISLARFAAWALDSDPTQSERAALAAKAFAGEFIPLLVEQSIQAHGGIGFTFEFDLHHYLRRALVLAKGFLPPSECHELLGASFLTV